MIGVDKFKKVIKDISQMPIFKYVVLALLFFVALTTIHSVSFFPQGIGRIKVGKPSPLTIKAPRTIEFEDVARTETLRRKAYEGVKKVYKYDASALPRVDGNIRDFFNSVRGAKLDQTLTPKARLDLLRNKFGPIISEDILKTCLNLTDEGLNRLESKTVEIVTGLMHGHVKKEDLATKKGELDAIASELRFGEDENKVIAEVGSVFLEANYLFNSKETEELRRRAAAMVKPYIVQKMKGEIVVREGEIVSEQQFKILRELGLLTGAGAKKISGLALLVLSMLGAFGIYVYKYQRKIFDNARLIFLLGILLTMAVLMARIITPFFSPYLIPIAGIAMLTTILFNPQVALVMLLLSGLLTGVMTESLQYVIVAVLSGLFAIYMVSRISHRGDLTRAALLVSLSLFYLCFAMSFIGGLTLRETLFSCSMGLVSGFLSGVLTIGMLPFLESAFHITTDIRLLELSNPNSPLLRELMMKAPGTYNHSVVTGNLAAAAAEDVGVNPLLARVGAYYHDIGKMKRPFFFTENQLGEENPHDRTNPNLSCLIITAHVKEGVELAKKHRLPREIIDIIREHHGTSLVSYFFHRAKEKVEKEQVCEADFRYSGVKPQTPEAAFVMLADSVEATARTISKPSPPRLEQLIRKITRNKLEDGQLDESHLTLSDLEKVTQAFINELTSIYHTRISYGYPPEEGLGKSGDSYGNPRE